MGCLRYEYLQNLEQCSQTFPVVDAMDAIKARTKNATTKNAYLKGTFDLFNSVCSITVCLLIAWIAEVE